MADNKEIYYFFDWANPEIGIRAGNLSLLLWIYKQKDLKGVEDNTALEYGRDFYKIRKKFLESHQLFMEGFANDDLKTPSDRYHYLQYKSRLECSLEGFPKH